MNLDSNGAKIDLNRVESSSDGVVLRDSLFGVKIGSIELQGI